VASRGAARNRMFGRHGTRPPGTTTCAARSSLHALRRQCRRRKRGPGAQKPPRWSAERRASYVIGREAPRKRLACGVDKRVHARLRRTIACRTGAQRGTRAPVGAPPTPHRDGHKFTTRAQSRRGNELGCLTSEDVTIATGRGAAAALLGANAALVSPLPGVNRRRARA
jgi:hypothetical protein